MIWIFHNAHSIIISNSHALHNSKRVTGQYDFCVLISLTFTDIKFHFYESIFVGSVDKKNRDNDIESRNVIEWKFLPRLEAVVRPYILVSSICRTLIMYGQNNVDQNISI